MIPGSQGTAEGGQIRGAQGTYGDEQADLAAQGIGSTEDILAEARTRYQQSTTYDGDNRVNALDDLAFLAGDQWKPEDRQARAMASRPCLTINTLPTYLHQVTNDQRQNTPGIKIHPVDDGADQETAKIIQGMIRHMEYDSNADVAYDTAVNSAAAVGFGFFRLVTEYCDETSFDQDIRFRRIRNSLSVRIDPLSQEADGSDMRWCFLDSLMPREGFRRQYPRASAGDANLIGQEQYAQWIMPDTVRVCEYYAIETRDAEVVLLADGTTAYADEVPPDAVIVKRRPGSRSRVVWRKITGVEILEESEIPCKWIPVFPVWGDEIDIEGRVFRSGLVRNAKDPSRMYNYWMTCATEEVALRAKSPYVIAEGQDEGYENQWQMANRVSLPTLKYKPKTVDGLLVPPPQRQPMADVPVGTLAMAAHARDNIKATTGLFDSSLGANSTATSGKQELAQQQQGDMANFHYADNLAKAIRHCGRCIVDMIPHVYDTERVVRILGEDQSISHATINQRNADQLGAIERVLHDVTVGKYDVTVRTGPSYTTMRQESAEFFEQAMQAAKDPATASVVSYLAIKNQDVPGADVAAKMMASLLPPPAKAVLDESEGDGEEQQQPIMTQTAGPVPPEQAGRLLDQLGIALQQAKEQLKKVDADKAQTELLKQQEAMQEMQLRAQLEPIEKEIQRRESIARQMEAEAKLITARADAQRAAAEAAAMPERLEIERRQAEQQPEPAEA